MKAVVTIRQDYNLTEAKAILVDLKKEAEIFQKRHGGVVEMHEVKELEQDMKNTYRRLKRVFQTQHEQGDTGERKKRNIFRTILHGIADVATGKEMYKSV